MRLDPPERLFQLACAQLNHGGTSMWTSTRRFTRFQLTNQLMHLDLTELLASLDRRTLADHLDQPGFQFFANQIATITEQIGNLFYGTLGILAREDAGNCTHQKRIPPKGLNLKADAIERGTMFRNLTRQFRAHVKRQRVEQLLARHLLIA
jgi:hypothetical protein